MKELKKMTALLLLWALLVANFAACGTEAVTSTKTKVPSVGASSEEEEIGPAESEESVPDESSEGASLEQSAVESTIEPESNSPFTNVEVQLPLCDEVTSVSIWTYMLPPIINYVAEDYSQNVSYAYLEELTNVHADVTAVSLFQATETLTLAVAAGDLCDITVGLQQFYANGVEFVYNSGLLVNLMDYQEEMPNFFGLLEADPDLYRDVLTENNVIPYCYQLDEKISNKQGMVIRSDWLNEVGMDIPQTYDELHDVLTAFKSELGVKAPLWFSYTGGTLNAYLSNGFGVTNSDSTTGAAVPSFFMAVDGKVKYSPLEEGFYDYLSLMHQWYEEGLISPDFINGTLDSRPADDDLTNYGVYLTSQDGYETIYNMYENVEITAMADMVQEVGDTLHISGTNASRAKAFGAAISAEASDIELCCKYMDFFYSEEGTYAAFFGEEGVTYEIDDDGNISYTDIIAADPEMTLSNAALVYCEQQSAGILLSEMDYILYGQTVIDAMEVWNEVLDDDTWDYPSMASMTTEESEKFSGIYSDIQTYVQEMMLKFITGISSLDSDYDTFQKTIESMDIQQCIEIKQTALDRYYAR